MNKILLRYKSKNFINLFSVFFLSLILFPFAREPIQADDLTGYATVIQLNGDFGLLEGFRRWILLQFEMSSHFVPTGWSFQWVQYAIVDFFSKYTEGNFHFIWQTMNLCILVILTFSSIRNIVSGLSTFIAINDSNLKDLKCAFIVLIFGASVTIHSPWSIDPFASHLAFGLLTTFFYSLIFRTTIDILLDSDRHLENRNRLKYVGFATLGLTTYDLFISLLFVSTFLILMYSKIFLDRTTNKISGRHFLSSFGLVYPVGFFILTRLINQVPEYEGTRLLVNVQNIKAAFIGIVSTYQPVGTLKAIQVYNQPITLHITVILVCMILIYLTLYFKDLAEQHKFIKNNGRYSKEIICFFALISFTVVGTQVLNERWGEHVGNLGNVYLFYSTSLIVGVSALGFTAYELIFTHTKRHILRAIYPVILISLVTSTSTNWTVLKRDGRTPGTELIAIAYETSSLENERCEAELEFRKIGYPEGYASIVIGAVKSFGTRNLGENFCELSKIKE